MLGGIGLEEHVIFQDLEKQVDTKYQHIGFLQDEVQQKIGEVGQLRLDAMNKTRTEIQVLSWPARGADTMDGNTGIEFAKSVNNRIFEAISKSTAPDRFRGFAHLPTRTPEKAVEELRRCVTELKFVGALISGMQNDKFLDDIMFDPILTEAEKLNVPIYLHPGLCPESVRKAYYYSTDNLSQDAANVLSIAGFGWHSEVGLHILRMCYAGTFDRHPKLKIIIGHNGELLPLMFERADTFFAQLHLKRLPSEILRSQVWVTISGIWDIPALMTVIDTFGVNHICWSVDYPYIPTSIPTAKTYIKKIRKIFGDRVYRKIMHENANIGLNIL